MWTGIEISIGVYCALVGGLFAFQRHLMYFPAKMTAPPSAFGLSGVEDIFLETSDKVRLQTWVHAARPGHPTLLYFHGNALHLGERAPWFKAFVDAGFDLVAVSHRGFGKSEGSPTEAGLYTDARIAIDYAQHSLSSTLRIFVRLFQTPAQKIDASAMMLTACSTGAAVRPKGPNGIHRSVQSDQ